MTSTYKVTGINLKSMPMGDYDRLLTILTREEGLVRAIVPGARKHKSSLGGRSSLFVVNHLLMVRGRNLDKVIQAETIESYPRLSQHLSKLTISQYLAELVLIQALSEQPQEQLFTSLTTHLNRLEQLDHEPLNYFQGKALIYLNQGIYDLLTLAGVSPRIHRCCLTQATIIPELNDCDWRVGFSPEMGGMVCLAALPSPVQPFPTPLAVGKPTLTPPNPPKGCLEPVKWEKPSQCFFWLTAQEAWLLQQLTQPDGNLNLLFSHLQPLDLLTTSLKVERVLRHYVHYHLERVIRSASLLEACFSGSLPE